MKVVLLLILIPFVATAQKDSSYKIYKKRLGMGTQYGIGRIIDNSINDANRLELTSSHNLNLYVLYKMRNERLHVGLRYTFINFDKQSIENFFSKNYEKNGELIQPMKKCTLEVYSPYIGYSHLFSKGKFEIEPFIRVGVSMNNYVFSNIKYERIDTLYNEKYRMLSDIAVSHFLFLSAGIQGKRKINNLITLLASITGDYGKSPVSELMESTYVNSELVNKRNIYFQNNVHNIYFNIGFELSIYNIVYQNEKNLDKFPRP